MPMDASCNAASEATHRPFQLSSPIFRPMVFDKMEQLVREMQDPENGIPIRSQKLFLTSIPSAFMGYDLVEWIMEHFSIEDSVEAIHIANMLCQHGYFFPIGDGKSLLVKDDSSLYKFQEPCFWPSRRQQADDVEYAIYLFKRSTRTKQKHALDEWEQDEMNRIKKKMAIKWEQIMTQAEEQVKQAKDRKKGDKIVTESQERAYWRVYRTPPGIPNTLEQSPTGHLRQNMTDKRRIEKLELQIKLLQSSLNSVQVKSSQAVESLISYCELHCEYEPFLVAPLPSNPWITDDPSLWHFNNSLVDVLTERRLKKWGLSISELFRDPTGVREFEAFLRTEYSHENIRFWKAVEKLRNGPNSTVAKTVKEIYEEFLAAGAPCEVNVDGRTIEETLEGVRHPSRFTYDKAQEHVYHLMKKDSYPRFMRSDYYKSLLTNAVQPGTQKKKFFSFGIQGKKKLTSSALHSGGAPGGPGGSNQVSLRRRGSDKSLNEDDKGFSDSLSHSHSAGNIPKVDASDVPYRLEDNNESPDIKMSGSSQTVHKLHPAIPTPVQTFGSQKKFQKSITISHDSPDCAEETSGGLFPGEVDSRRRKSEIPSGSIRTVPPGFIFIQQLVKKTPEIAPEQGEIPSKPLKGDLVEEDDFREELYTSDELSEDSQTDAAHSPWSSVEMAATCPLAEQEIEENPIGGNDVCIEASRLFIGDGQCDSDTGHSLDTGHTEQVEPVSPGDVTLQLTVVDPEVEMCDVGDTVLSESDTDDINSFVIGPPPSMTRDMSLTEIPKCPPPPKDVPSPTIDLKGHSEWESEDNLVFKVQEIEDREDMTNCPPPDKFADEKWGEESSMIVANKVPRKSKLEGGDPTPGRVPRPERDSRKKKKKLGSKFSLGGSSEMLERCYSTEILDRAYRRSFSISCEPQRQQMFSSTDLSRLSNLSASLSRSDKSVMTAYHSRKMSKTSVTFSCPTKKTESTQFPPKTTPILKKTDDESLSTHCPTGEHETSNKRVTIVETKTAVIRETPSLGSLKQIRISGQERELDPGTDRIVTDMTSPRQSSDSESDACASATEVCPWEDEENLKLETHPPFVKTYATFGYL